MTFCEEILATFIGTFIAFIFGIIAFKIQLKAQKKADKSELIKSFKKEIELNIEHLQIWKNNEKAIIENVGSDDTDIFYYIRYSDFISYFMSECAKKGIIFEIMKNTEYRDFNNIYNRYNIYGENYINKIITDYKDGISKKKEVIKNLQYQVKILDEDEKMLSNLLKKLEEIIKDL